jgi:hypothetical protein
MKIGTDCRFAICNLLFSGEEFDRGCATATRMKIGTDCRFAICNLLFSGEKQKGGQILAN